ncbi:MAG: MFS transporter [Candidatus Hermodarchaeota archaeon]
MIKKSPHSISPRFSLFSAFLIHCSVEIPFFIFPVILLLVRRDLFPNLGELSWIGLGILGTIGTLAAGLPSPYFGRLADKYQRGWLMFVSLLLASLGSLLIGLLGNYFIVMAISIILMGVGLALYHPPGLSWVSTAYENPETHSYSSHYVKILALHGIGGSLGASIGPLSVYFFLDSLGWRLIYLYWSIPLTIIAFGFWLFVGRYEPQRESSPAISSKNNSLENNTNFSNWWKFSPLMLIFCFIITMSITRGMVNFILAAFLSEIKGIQITTAAFFIGFSTFIGAVGQISGGFFGDKYGEKAVLSITAVVQVAILLGIFLINNSLLLLILYLSLGVINALFWPSTNSLVAKNSSQQGVAFGFVMLSANIVGALGPSIDGFLLVIDPNYLLIFAIACFFSFCGFVFMLLLKQKSQKIKKL